MGGGVESSGRPLTPYMSPYTSQLGLGASLKAVILFAKSGNRHRHGDQTYGYQRGSAGDELGDLDRHIYTTDITYTTDH